MYFLREKFNYVHYAKVVTERYRKKLPMPALHYACNNHKFLNKKIMDNYTQEIYTISGVMRNWIFGWFLSFTIKRENVIKCILFHDPDVNAKIYDGVIFSKKFKMQMEENKERYTFI